MRSRSKSNAKTIQNIPKNKQNNDDTKSSLNNEDKNILSQKGVLAAGSNQIGNQILSIL